MFVWQKLFTCFEGCSGERVDRERSLNVRRCLFGIVVQHCAFTWNGWFYKCLSFVPPLCFTERILSEEKALFEDVVEDFSSIDSIKSRFEEWKNKHEDCYRNAYISLCLPKLFAPFIRLQLLDWNPFEVQLIPLLWTRCATELGKDTVLVMITLPPTKFDWSRLHQACIWLDFYLNAAHFDNVWCCLVALGFQGYATANYRDPSW